MRTTIDLTDSDLRRQGGFPDPSIISDAGDIRIVFSDVEIQMTYEQFFVFYEKVKSWHESVGSPESMVINEPE